MRALCDISRSSKTQAGWSHPESLERAGPEILQVGKFDTYSVKQADLKVNFWGIIAGKMIIET